MRKHFASLIQSEINKNKNINLLTADLGFGVFDSIKLNNKDQYFNFGASEQLMLGAGIGMANSGKIPLCYSITPFLLFRPYEFIRNYINYENIPVKLVGAGRDKDYSHDGISHWAEDDEISLSHFKNIKIFKPDSEEELSNCLHDFLYNNSPSYLNLRR